MQPICNHIFLFGTKEGVPFAEVYLGNGPVSTALKDLSKKHRQTGRMHYSMENEVILQFPAPVMAEFVSQVEGPLVMYNKNLTAEEAAEAFRKDKGVHWCFWVHQDKSGEVTKKE